MQYSKRCKLFVFPKEFLRHDWLTTLNFYVVHSAHSQIELVGFVVLKLVDCTSYEVTIIPEKVTIDKSMKVYKLTRNQGEVCEKNLDSSVLLERQVSDSMGNVGGHHTDNSFGTRGSTNRLFEDLIDSNLMDGTSKNFISNSSGNLGNGQKKNGVYRENNFAGNKKKNFTGNKLHKLMNPGNGNGAFGGFGPNSGNFGFNGGKVLEHHKANSNTSSSNQLLDEELEFENTKASKNYETDLLGTLKMGGSSGGTFNNGSRNMNGNLPNMHHRHGTGTHSGHNNYFNKSEQYNGHHGFGLSKPNMARNYGGNNLMSALGSNPGNSGTMFRKTESTMFRNTEPDDFGMSEEDLGLDKISPFSDDDLDLDLNLKNSEPSTDKLGLAAAMDLEVSGMFGNLTGLNNNVKLPTSINSNYGKNKGFYPKNNRNKLEDHRNFIEGLDINGIIMNTVSSFNMGNK